MSERSGLGLVEVAVLEAFDTVGARTDRTRVKCARVVNQVEEQIGLAGKYAYEILCYMARPWTVPILLVDFHGNFGSRDDEAASPRYVECRLSAAGAVVLAAERRQLGPVPVGLINGNIYRSGTRPPLDPHRVITALRRALDDPGVSDDELLAIVGSPDFLTDCDVGGDLAAFSAGEATALRLQGRVTVADDGRVVVESLPPNARPADVLETIRRRVESRPWAKAFPVLDQAVTLPIATVENMSTGTIRFVCTPRAGVEPERLRGMLADVAGVVTEIAVALPAPLADMLRSWVSGHNNEDLTAALDALNAAIAPSGRRPRQPGGI